jgi:glycosyltransferase involved in cell wall biosynthesis
VAHRIERIGHGLTAIGSAAAVLGSVHAACNLRLLRVPRPDPAPVPEPVSVLLPVRNEAHRVVPCLRAVLAQRGVPDLDVIVLDDASEDGTAVVVRRTAGDDPRVRVLGGAPLPAGWLGKPFACAQLAAAASGTVLVFLDADVVLAPHAVAATVTLLRASGLDLVSPYPRQRAESIGERLLQPLLQWSWLTLLPLRLAERSPRPSLSAANGQFLAVDATAYARAGGHTAVRGEVLDDIALLRALKRSGGRGVVADGTRLATCRMYDDWAELRAGYTKSLWSAFGSPAGAAAGIAALVLVYVVPPLAALAGSRVGMLGYAAAVTGRVLVARRVRARCWPDPLAHPLAISALAVLTVESLVRRRTGGLRWKERLVAPGR